MIISVTPGLLSFLFPGSVGTFSLPAHDRACFELANLANVPQDIFWILATFKAVLPSLDAQLCVFKNTVCRLTPFLTLTSGRLQGTSLSGHQRMTLSQGTFRARCWWWWRIASTRGSGPTWKRSWFGCGFRNALREQAIWG